MFALDFFLSIESEVTPTVNVPPAHILRGERWMRQRGSGWGEETVFIWVVFILYPSCLAHEGIAYVTPLIERENVFWDNSSASSLSIFLSLGSRRHVSEKRMSRLSLSLSLHFFNLHAFPPPQCTGRAHKTSLGTSENPLS